MAQLTLWTGLNWKRFVEVCNFSQYGYLNMHGSHYLCCQSRTRHPNSRSGHGYVMIFILEDRAVLAHYSGLVALLVDRLLGELLAVLSRHRVSNFSLPCTYPVPVSAG